MPNVPNVPGVPALASFAVASLVTLLTEDEVPTFQPFGAPEWGIFLDGEPAIGFASFVSVSYKQEWTVADYPVEQGAFQSYDKVQHPFDARLRISSDSTPQARQQLLNDVDAIANATDLYDIVTPDRTYLSVNVVHYDYSRTATSNNGFLVIDIWFQEIRVSATADFSNTQQPTEAGQQGIGTVQAQPVTTDQKINAITVKSNLQ